jgi:prepilin-type N-terminal cleavage/methylation domain-containing protein
MKKGFTLIEMLMAISLFAIVAVSFIGILALVTQIQVQSSSSTAVNQESQFLLQKLQYYIGSASLVDIPTSTVTSTLKLEMASSSLDPTYITLASGTVYLQQTASGTLQALTSNKVVVSSLAFTRQSNPPGHDAVSISYAIAYNSSNIAQEFSQFLQTSVEHVSAATFDTGVYPSVNNSEPLGATGQTWSSINSIIDFSGSNVGIGTVSPQQPLEVNGGVRLNPQPPVSEPTCNSAARGTLWFQSGGSGKDSLYLCAQNASSTLAWQQIY